jgi:hypothetical protein
MQDKGTFAVRVKGRGEFLVSCESSEELWLRMKMVGIEAESVIQIFVHSVRSLALMVKE